MVVLDMSETLNGWGVAALVGVILFIGVEVIYCVTVISENIYSLWRWIGLVALAFPIAICMYYIPKNVINKYKLYPNGATIEEISEEYGITDVDGLIVTAHKKSEKSNE